MLQRWPVLQHRLRDTPSANRPAACVPPARAPRAARRPAEQRDELTSSYVEHGLPSGTRCASLPQAQDAPEVPQVLGADLNPSESSEKADLYGHERPEG